MKEVPLSRDRFFISANRLADAVSLRYPYVRQASIDEQADGARAWDTVGGGPELDAFQHLGRKTQLDFGGDRCLNGGHDSPFDDGCGFWAWGRIAQRDRAIPSKISRCSRLDARARYASFAAGPALSAMALQTRSIAGE